MTCDCLLLKDVRAPSIYEIKPEGTNNKNHSRNPFRVVASIFFYLLMKVSQACRFAQCYHVVPKCSSSCQLTLQALEVIPSLASSLVWTSRTLSADNASGSFS
ncbi:hypothetical protein IC582_006515 [Cucumis melo]